MAQYTLSKSKFNTNVPVATATNIIFTSTAVPDGFTGIDISEDADGSVMVWNDGTIYYISTLSTTKVQAPVDSSSLFQRYSTLTSIDFSYFATNNVTNMNRMFSACVNLVSLKLSSFDTSNVTDMSYMFSDCSTLSSLDLTSFNTSNVTSMVGMFGQDRELTTLNLSSFDTSNVIDMSYMFYDTKLTYLDLSNFNTSSVTNMSTMFSTCGALALLDISSFDTSNVINMSYMFAGCEKLVSLDLSNFNTSNVTNIESIFAFCSALVSLDLSNFNTSNATNTNHIIFDCSNLEKVCLGENFKWIEETGFNTPSLDGADGNWYDINGIAYAPTEIPSNKSMTYYASKPLYEADLANWKNIVYQTVDNYKEAIHNKEKIKIKELIEGVKSLHFNIYTDSDMEV